MLLINTKFARIAPREISAVVAALREFKAQGVPGPGVTGGV